MQTVVALVHLLLAPLPLSLQLPLLLLLVGLQLRNALTQTVLVQQTVGVLQLQAVSTAQGLVKKGRKQTRARQFAWCKNCTTKAMVNIYTKACVSVL